MSKNRFYSNNNLDINYIDYYKIKSGCAILKTIKREDNNAVLNKFKSYNNWQTLSASYFPYINNNVTEISYLKNLCETNESFIDKCESDNYLENSICIKEGSQNILYPYGKIISKKEPNIQFPSKLYMCRWCNKSSKNVICNAEFPNNTCNNECDCRGKRGKSLFI